MLLKSATLELENQPPAVDLLLNPKRLPRVFYNLIHNATDAMPQGGKIILRFHAKEREVVTEHWLPECPLIIGITAGASCPNNVIEDAILRVFELHGIARDELQLH